MPHDAPFCQTMTGLVREAARGSIKDDAAATFRAALFRIGPVMATAWHSADPASISGRQYPGPSARIYMRSMTINFGAMIPRWLFQLIRSLAARSACCDV